MSRLYVDEDGIKITQTIVTLPNGKRMIGRPSNPRTARGFSMCVRLDEFSMHLKQKEIWQQRRRRLPATMPWTWSSVERPRGKAMNSSG